METEKNLKKNIIDIAIVVIISLEKYMEKNEQTSRFTAISFKITWNIMEYYAYNCPNKKVSQNVQP